MKTLTRILPFIILSLPFLAAAQPTYTPIVGIPGVDLENPSFDDYINSVYALAISLAALLAVIKIVIAGVKWMMTDIVTSKSEAKKDIQGALVGLLVILSAVLILTVINPDIIDVDVSPPQAREAEAPPPGLGDPDYSGDLENRGDYDAVRIDDNAAAIAAFEADCVGAGNVFDKEPATGVGGGLEARCYTMPSGASAVIRIPYPTDLILGRGQCTRDTDSAEASCASRGGIDSSPDRQITPNATGGVGCATTGHLLCYIP